MLTHSHIIQQNSGTKFWLRKERPPHRAAQERIRGLTSGIINSVLGLQSIKANKTAGRSTSESTSNISGAEGFLRNRTPKGSPWIRRPISTVAVYDSRGIQVTGRWFQDPWGLMNNPQMISINDFHWFPLVPINKVSWGSPLALIHSIRIFESSNQSIYVTMNH